MDRSVTVVESPVASARTQPSTVTSPDGGAGTSGEASPAFSVCAQPRSTSSSGPPGSGPSGVTTSTPDAPSRVW